MIPPPPPPPRSIARASSVPPPPTFCCLFDEREVGRERRPVFLHAQRHCFGWEPGKNGRSGRGAGKKEERRKTAAQKPLYMRTGVTSFRYLCQGCPKYTREWKYAQKEEKRMIYSHLPLSSIVYDCVETKKRGIQSEGDITQQLTCRVDKKRTTKRGKKARANLLPPPSHNSFSRIYNIFSRFFCRSFLSPLA